MNTILFYDIYQKQHNVRMEEGFIVAMEEQQVVHIVVTGIMTAVTTAMKTQVFVQGTKVQELVAQQKR